jgi:DNA-binding PadR family transcriptional regulator
MDPEAGRTKVRLDILCSRSDNRFRIIEIGGNVAKRKIANPLALAVMACLAERPMHPYEIATTLRSRGKEDSIRLNYGSLYAVVESLQRHGLIVRRETEREGRRPERTVYRLTDAGRIELVDWLSELLSTPVKEYTQYEAGLSLIAVLPPEDAAGLLRQRCKRLELELAQIQSVEQVTAAEGVPRLFLIESEYERTLKEADLAWTRRLADEIDAGTLQGIEGWRAFHQQLGEGDAERYWHPAEEDTGRSRRSTETQEDQR